ncbi:hypothetical protein B0H19DRAFT_1071925 [Mycena capillaripes]|nr:hypothetical protein B0H19DRAFT_1071925 [Mycena capillaripes]
MPTALKLAATIVTLSVLLPFVYGQGFLSHCINPALFDGLFMSADCTNAAGVVSQATINLSIDCFAYEELAFRLACPFPNGVVVDDPSQDCIACSVVGGTTLSCTCQGHPVTFPLMSETFSITTHSVCGWPTVEALNIR